VVMATTTTKWRRKKKGFQNGGQVRVGKN
jgi:hypothetical protein